MSLRADLAEAGWGVEAVAALLGRAATDALHREIRLPALRAARAALADRAEVSAVAVLTALFMLGEPVPAAALDAVLPHTGAAGARQIGLVGQVDETGRVRARVDLRPHEAVDDAGEVRWWVASDLGELVTGRPLAPDHVLGIGGAGLTLAGLTPRTPVRTALDLGCGCGIQTLYLLRHAEHVVATDISARALAFTAFNAALAGVSLTAELGSDADSAAGTGRLELRQGSLLESVAGRRFDLIASNPPFVLTPPAVREAGLPLMEYRDAGGPVLPALVAGLGEHLEPGGSAVMLGNWEHRSGAGGSSWRDAVGSWIPKNLDAWVIEREVQDPVEYATMWLRDGGLTPERDADGFDAALEAWIDDFEAHGIEGIGFGYLIVHRPVCRRRPWRVMEEVATSGEGVLGPHVSAVVAAQDRLAGLDDDAVAALRPVLAPDVTEERHLVPGAGEPTLILLRQGGGLGRSTQATTAVAALAGVADGELSVEQIASAVAALTGVDALALRGELVDATRRLLAVGMLVL
ncbi:N5-glutamine S-adenosyl-L-methionine-dependent methyltransferase [Actinomyces viscosus]|uniref:N5-glutamine S-adenosyl-L-methionine-dependent methyltransferase n=1 Tax=Actinomyces viscosus TaxID=1656 RepID=A0A3S4VB93_ACTVI|nr:N5-glutamine S-adenosyl-L-methionine-dependent methyltransferase [Actinomyces viscosus]